MASSNDNVSMALFCDFENVALGVRDANYEKFDIKPVLERLLLKGSIVVKKAYCDWDRYKGFKAPMHEGNFELIEIPHVRQSGKNSADIRMVVDALDLCYTKSHVNTFVIISGDSDFSPLVSKLRENNKKVIGVGVKQSTSDLLVANCDEFIFYDDLVRESRRVAAKRDSREAPAAVKRSPEEEKRRRDDMDKRRSEAVEMAVETFDALVSERGDSGKIWASVLKEAIKRRKPDFSESYYGFRTFGNLLEEAKARGLLEFGRDEKSGAYVYRNSGATPAAAVNDAVSQDTDGADNGAPADVADSRPEGRQDGRRGRSRGGRKQNERKGGVRHANDGAGEGAGESDEPVFQHGDSQADEGDDAVNEHVAEDLEVASAEHSYAEAEAEQAAEDAAAWELANAMADRQQGGHAPAKRKSPVKPPARAAKAALKKDKVKPQTPWAQAVTDKPVAEPVEAAVEQAPLEAVADVADVAEPAPAKGRARAPAKSRAKGVSRITAAAADAAAATEAPVEAETAISPAAAIAAQAIAAIAAQAAEDESPKPGRKPAARARRPAKAAKSDS